MGCKTRSAYLWVFLCRFKNASISLWRGLTPFANYDYKIFLLNLKHGCNIFLLKPKPDSY